DLVGLGQGLHINRRERSLWKVVVLAGF
ncbi:hypothetical protein TorRG33x02_275960, partial [Trema orientale]